VIETAFGHSGFGTNVIDRDGPIAAFPDQVVGHFKQSKFGVPIRHKRRLVD
jgi:hypothetical protein